MRMGRGPDGDTAVGRESGALRSPTGVVEDGGVCPEYRTTGSRATVDQSLQPRGGSVMFFTATPMTLFSLPSTLRR